jgi:microtubule-associated protein-like 6
VASGDDKGKVKIFRYPSMMKGSLPVEGKGHSSHVTNVRFAKNDLTQTTYLYSTGGNDTCVFQWKIISKV